MYLFIFEIQSILEASYQTHFWPWAPKKVFDQLLIFVNLYEDVKNQLIQSIYSSGTAFFRVPWTDFWHPFLTIYTPKIFNQLLICVNLYQMCMKKLRLFHQLTWRNSWFQNSAGTSFFPIMKFVQEHSRKYNSSSWNKFSDQMVL